MPAHPRANISSESLRRFRPPRRPFPTLLGPHALQVPVGPLEPDPLARRRRQHRLSHLEEIAWQHHGKDLSARQLGVHEPLGPKYVQLGHAQRGTGKRKALK